jgi:LCP family protein required for cell wall assembly
MTDESSNEETVIDAPRADTDTGQSTERVARWRRIVSVVAWAVLAVAVVFVGWAAYQYRSAAAKLELSPAVKAEVSAELSAPSGTIEMPEPVYVLILGIDRRPDETYGRTDSMLVARLDAANRSVSLLSIPRDSRVPIAGHGLTKINAAWPYGGPALTIRTVKQFTGLPINHYVEIDIIGFSHLVDALGGIWVDVDKPIYPLDAQSMSDPGEPAILPGRQRLDGRHALIYTRSRLFPDGDFSRMRHQQVFLRELGNQALQTSNIGRLPGMVDSVASSMKTDMSLRSLMSLARDFEGVKQSAIKTYTVPGRPQTIAGVSYIITDKAQAKILFDDFKNGRASKVQPY